MPPRSKIKTQIPEPIRDELNGRLVAGGFSNYDGLTDWLNLKLKEEGLQITVSRTALFEHGKAFQEEFENEMAETRQFYNIAKIALADTEDPEGIVRDATIRTLQTRLLKLTMSLRDADKAGDDVHLLVESTQKIARALADLGRTDIISQKWKIEVRTKANQAAEAAAKIAKKGGLSAESIDEIKRRILGIAT